MTQFNSFNPSYSSPDIEGAMNKILKKRTGKELQRNVESAKLPQHKAMDKDEIANKIFDNIINKQIAKSEAPEEAPVEETQSVEQTAQGEPVSEDSTAAYYEEMDALLFGEGDAQEQHNVEHEAPEETPVSSYDVLDHVLFGVDQHMQTEAQNQEPAAPPQSQDDFSRTLDELLDNHENPFV